MEQIPRGSDGRRLFTAEFKREQIDRVLRGEVTAAALAEFRAAAPVYVRAIESQFASNLTDEDLGLVARILSKHPHLTPYDVKTVLRAVADNAS